MTPQDAIWQLGEQIGDKEGRFDICVAAAGINRENIDCLETPAALHESVC